MPAFEEWDGLWQRRRPEEVSDLSLKLETIIEKSKVSTTEEKENNKAAENNINVPLSTAPFRVSVGKTIKIYLFYCLKSIILVN